MSSPIRPLLRQLRPNGIVEVASLGLDRPGLIPLWFGESDLVTPEFIREAAAKALDEGKTFYTWARGIPELRQAIADFHRRTVGVAIDPERVTVPGAAMLAILMALHLRGRDRRQYRDRRPGLAEHLSCRASGRRGGPAGAAG